MDLEWCIAPDKGLPRPDITFFIEAEPEDLKSRPGYGDERYEKFEFQQKVYNQFKLMKESEGDWTPVPLGDVDTMHAKMWEKVSAELDKDPTDL